MDPAKRAVRVRGAAVELTFVEFEILNALARNPGRVFTRDMLLTRIWGDSAYRDPRTIDVHIRHLREKLETDPKEPEYLFTVRGVGYRFRDEAALAASPAAGRRQSAPRMRSLRTRLALSLFLIVARRGRDRRLRRAAIAQRRAAPGGAQEPADLGAAATRAGSTRRSTAATPQARIDMLVRDAADSATARVTLLGLYAVPGELRTYPEVGLHAAGRDPRPAVRRRARSGADQQAGDRDRGRRRGPRRRGRDPADLRGPAHAQARRGLGDRLLATAERHRRGGARRAQPRPDRGADRAAGRGDRRLAGRPQRRAARAAAGGRRRPRLGGRPHRALPSRRPRRARPAGPDAGADAPPARRARRRAQALHRDRVARAAHAAVLARRVPGAAGGGRSRRGGPAALRHPAAPAGAADAEARDRSAGPLQARGRLAGAAQRAHRPRRRRADDRRRVRAGARGP